MGQCDAKVASVINEYEGVAKRFSEIDPFSGCDAKPPPGAGAVDPFGTTDLSILYIVDDDASRSYRKKKLEQQQLKAQNQQTLAMPQFPLMTAEQARRELEAEQERKPQFQRVPSQATVTVGDRVTLFDGKAKGVVKFLGRTRFSTGDFVGVELESAVGMNDGTVQGKEYFRCEPNHGIFARPTAVVKLEPDEARQNALADTGTITNMEEVVGQAAW